LRSSRPALPGAELPSAAGSRLGGMNVRRRGYDWGRWLAATCGPRAVWSWLRLPRS